MTSFLVVTAMGSNRPGIVNELTKLVTEADCNIVDSRMAVFGDECTLILLLSGSWNAIARFEIALSQQSAQLELITLIKRTSEHISINYPTRILIKLQGVDAPHCMGRFTQYLAERGIDLSSLSTKAKGGHQQITMQICLPESIVYPQLQTDFTEFADSLNLTISFENIQVTQ